MENKRTRSFERVPVVMVRRGGLEPPQHKAIRPSNVHVYRFRHLRAGCKSHVFDPLRTYYMVKHFRCQPVLKKSNQNC